MRFLSRFCPVLTDGAKPNSERQSGRGEERGIGWELGMGAASICIQVERGHGDGEWERSRSSEI